MGKNSAIEWTDHTFNPLMGCTKVSPACMNCYAERDMDHRYGKVAWGPNGSRVVTSDSNWRKPITWNQQFIDDMQMAIAGQYGVVAPTPQPNRPRVFCASLADVFEDWDGEVLDHHGNAHFTRDGNPFDFVRSPEGDGMDLDGYHYTTMDDVRARLFKLIDATPNLDWLLLTKRPENIRRMWPETFPLSGGFTGEQRGRRRNVWLGTTVENQEYANKRIPELLKCSDLSPVLFLSMEPLLGPIDLREVRTHEGHKDVLFVGSEGGWEYAGSRRGFINWVIAGGESGPDARPSHPDWFRSVRDQCVSAGVPFFFKQWGEWLQDAEAKKLGFIGSGDGKRQPMDESLGTQMLRVGKKKAGRLLDGVSWDQFPLGMS